MAFFTIVGIIVVAVILYKLFSNNDRPLVTVRKEYVVESKSDSSKSIFKGKQNHFVRAANISLLCKKYDCKPEDLQQTLVNETKAYSMTDRELMMFLMMLEEKANEEGHRHGIHPNDTSQAVVVSLLLDFGVKSGILPNPES